MSIEQIIIPLISTVLSAAATVIANKQLKSSDRTYDVCHELKNLYYALEDISYTGNDISNKLNQFEERNPSRSELSILVHMLEIQRENIKNGQEEINQVAELLEFKSADLGDLHIHLRGKKDRIELLYKSATNISDKLKKDIEPWEISQLLESPEAILDIDQSRNKDSMEKLKYCGEQSILTSQSDNFESLIANIPKLKEFINDNCDIQHLR